MQCSRCGAPIQQGMTFCPNCGTPYAPNPGAPGSSPQYDRTVAAPPPFNAGGQPYQPPSNQQPTPPPAGQPYTGYGTPPANPYAPQSPNAYDAQGGYGTPPPPPMLYNAPYAPPPGSFQPLAPQQPPQKKGPNVGLIIGIAALILVLIGGGFLAVKAFSHPNGQTGSSTPTPGVTATSGGNTPAVTATTAVTPTSTPATNQTASPSGSPIDTTAASIITNVQTTSSIDSNYFPTHLTNQFSVGSVVYVTFHLTLTQSGYVEAKVYEDNVYATQGSLAVTVGKYDHGYFHVTYTRASAGAFELYWCTQSNCSDAALAAVATFTVS